VREAATAHKNQKQKSRLPPSPPHSAGVQGLDQDHHIRLLMIKLMVLLRMPANTHEWGGNDNVRTKKETHKNEFVSMYFPKP
jgi:hypothetical protein